MTLELAAVLIAALAAATVVFVAFKLDSTRLDLRNAIGRAYMAEADILLCQQETAALAYEVALLRARVTKRRQALPAKVSGANLSFPSIELK